MVEYNIVMLYSGGADSYLMLKLAKMAGKIPYCILIDYGQKHVVELEYAEKQLKQEGVEFVKIGIPGLKIDSGLTGDLVEARWENVHAMNVPARNTIFLGIAMGIAESMGVDEVWIGCDMSDFYGQFPDCKQEYIGKMNEVSNISGVKPIEIVAPLLGMTKELILDILKYNFNIQLDDMYSGYEDPKSTCCKNEEYISILDKPDVPKPAGPIRSGMVGAG